MPYPSFENDDLGQTNLSYREIRAHKIYSFKALQTYPNILERRQICNKGSGLPMFTPISKTELPNINVFSLINSLNTTGCGAGLLDVNVIILTLASSSRPRAFNRLPRSLRTQYRSYNYKKTMLKYN